MAAGLGSIRRDAAHALGVCFFACLAVSFTTHPAFGATPTGVVINEIHYHPVEEPAFDDDGYPLVDLETDVHEFIELHNAGEVSLDLSGWKFVDGVRYTFPGGTIIGPDAYVVITRHPIRLRAIDAYAFAADSIILGPWQGQLGNNGDTINLENAGGTVVDSVTYSDSFPWPTGADALGANRKWTGLAEADYQYRGRSLERISPRHPGHDPANWKASPTARDPTPGGPNHGAAPEPELIVLDLELSSETNPATPPASNVPVTVAARFSRPVAATELAFDFFADDINSTDEPVTRVAMQSAGPAGVPVGDWFRASLPAFPARSVVRYRIMDRRTEPHTRISPRVDEPSGWHAFFLPAARPASTNEVYDLFISEASIRQLSRNLSANPRSGYRPALDVEPNGPWNDTVPAVFAHRGVVYDVQARYNGSFFRRNPNRQSYKIQFPRYQRFFGQRTLLVTDKDFMTVAGHRLYRNAGLPSSQTRQVHLFVNDRPILNRLELEEMDDRLLEQYHAEQARQQGNTIPEPDGHLFKSSGITDRNLGPYDRGEGSQLNDHAGWTSVQRYGWTYSSKNKDWLGFLELKQMIDAMWDARGRFPEYGQPSLRDYFRDHWDVHAMATYCAIRNWMGTWDDTVHNYFLWNRSGRGWTLLPWDFDADLGVSGAAHPRVSIWRGASDSGDNIHGTHFIKDSFFRAFPGVYRNRMYELNNTYLHPDNITGMGLTILSIPEFASARRDNVNQQCIAAVFTEPEAPINLTPRGGESVQGAGWMSATPYRHNTDPSFTHASTRWVIRRQNDYSTEPFFETTSTDSLTSMTIPFQKLDFGETYEWSCTYYDSEGRPSFPSAATPFQYGGSVERTTVLALETPWKFNDGGANLGTGWRFLDYDDSTWKEGPGPIGASNETLSFPLRTPLSLGGVTYYFRKTFNAAGPPEDISLRLYHFIDDGVAVYLNGREVYRANMGTRRNLSFFSRATTEVGTPQLRGPFEIESAQLRPGANVLSAEVHQTISTSPDLVFGLILEQSTENPALRTVRLNELMADNRRGVEIDGITPDWVELFNPTGAPVSLDGFSLSDNPGLPDQAPLPDGIEIPPFGYLALWSDELPAGIHPRVNLQLNRDGETLTLFQHLPERSEWRIVDQVTFGIQAPDLALARHPSGTGRWQAARPTPGFANEPRRMGHPRHLRINEWLARGSDGPDWIEIFNPQTRPVALAGIGVSDDPLIPFKTILPPLSFIAARGFLVLEADDQAASNGRHLGFRLSGDGESIALHDSSGSLIDLVEFGPQSEDITEGSLPDGHDTTAFFADRGSPERANLTDTDGDGLPDTWETLHQLDPGRRSDAMEDRDADGMRNLDEFLAGSDPNDPASLLKIMGVERVDQGLRIRVRRPPGRRVVVQYSNNPATDSWEAAGTISGEPLANQEDESVTDSRFGTGETPRFYRLIIDP